MFVESRPEKVGEIKGHGLNVVLIFSQQLMPLKMVPAQVDQRLGWRNRCLGEELWMNMTAKVLDSYLVEAGG